MAKLQDHPHIEDLQADRMRRTGCLLLILAPLLTLSYAAIVLTRPIIEMTRPRAEQMVRPQREGEVLLVTATFAGEGGYETANAIDELLNAMIVSNWETATLRVGRIDQVAETPDEARELAAGVEAAVVVWGEMSGDAEIVRISIADPLGAWEPAEQSFTLFADDDLHAGKLTEYLYNLLLIHSASFGDAYRYEYASSGFFNLYHGTPRTPFFSPLTAVYQIRSDLESEDISSIRQTLSLALAEKPTAELYLLSAMLNARIGDPDAAESALEKAGALDPAIVVDEDLRARLLIQTGELPEARALLDTLIEAGPTEASPLLERARLNDIMGLIEDADRDYQRYLALAPLDFIAHFEYIDRLIAREDWPLAEAALDTVPETIDWDNPPPFSLDERVALARSRLLVAAGDTQEALLTARNGINDYSLLTAITGAIYMMAGDVAEAETIWGADFLTTPHGQNQLAWLLATHGWAEIAEPYARSAVAQQMDVNFIHTLGISLLRMGRAEEALPYLEEAYQQGQALSYPEISADLGETYLALGDPENAIVYFSAYLAESTYIAPYQRDLILFQLAEARYRHRNAG